MVRRFDVETIVAVDASEGMLERFAAKLDRFPGVRVEVRAEDVMAMGVGDGEFDAVLCAMAMHWFPDKAGAAPGWRARCAPGRDRHPHGGPRRRGRVAAAARASGRTGGLDRLVSGERARRRRGRRYLRSAGLEPLDVWMERRRRHTDPDAFMARTRSVAAHLLDNSPGGHGELDRRIERALRDAAGPDGFVYDYCKLYAVARRPDA